jgi:hypothetical protein
MSQCIQTSKKKAKSKVIRKHNIKMRKMERTNQKEDRRRGIKQGA